MSIGLFVSLSVCLSLFLSLALSPAHLYIYMFTCMCVCTYLFAMLIHLAMLTYLHAHMRIYLYVYCLHMYDVICTCIVFICTTSPCSTRLYYPRALNFSLSVYVRTAYKCAYIYIYISCCSLCVSVGYLLSASVKSEPPNPQLQFKIFGTILSQGS